MYCPCQPQKIGRSFQLGINGDRAPCVSVLAMPVEPVILELSALESRRYRRTKLPRLGKPERDMSASESPRRSLHPFASARSGYTSRPSESSRVLAPHIIWWPQARLICTAPPSPVAGATPRDVRSRVWRSSSQVLMSCAGRVYCA
jgi:hypothetical protein